MQLEQLLMIDPWFEIILYTLVPVFCLLTVEGALLSRRNFGIENLTVWLQRTLFLSLQAAKILLYFKTPPISCIKKACERNKMYWLNNWSNKTVLYKNVNIRGWNSRGPHCVEDVVFPGIWLKARGWRELVSPLLRKHQISIHSHKSSPHRRRPARGPYSYILNERLMQLTLRQTSIY